MELVGRYRIERRIGEGAMADVYRAHDPSIDRVLAIKILKPEFRQHPEVVARFLREARAAGALSHPNIITIYDVGEADGYAYIAMELLAGEPLDEMIHRCGKLDLGDVIGIGRQLASALAYAHELGIVHRDIKPSNIFMCEGGRTAKILDFGIARKGEADPIRAELAALRTQVGQVLGTPRYMSPEQALGLDIDHRSDLFSLGVVLYEMITGQTAFGGTSIATIALQITQQKPEALGKLAPDCPRGLQHIVEKLLAKQPERRFQSGVQLEDALRREQDALKTEKHGRRRSLSLQIRLTLMMAVVTAAALLVSISTVLDRQYQAMERMALTSGSSIASFVSNNVSLRAVENAGLPAEQQDWMPVQAFITAAAQDPNVKHISVIDAFGVVRGSSEAAIVGKRFVPARGEAQLQQTANTAVSATADGRAFRFMRTIDYAGQQFGKVELVVGKSELIAAASSSRNLLIALGVAIFLVVIGVSYTLAQLLARPIRRLKMALNDVASGKHDFRISHNRSDEFGELFDGFNDLAAAIDERIHPSTDVGRQTSPSLDATRIDLPRVGQAQQFEPDATMIAPAPAQADDAAAVDRLRRRASQG